MKKAAAMDTAINHNPEKLMDFDAFFERRVPLALALALCVQAGSAVWWVSNRDADAHFQQRRIDQLEQAAIEARTSRTDMLERLARIEERLVAEAALLERIERRLSRGER